MKDKRIVLVPLYILILAAGYFYVKNVLEGVPASKLDNTEDKIVKNYDINITLNVQGSTINKSFPQKVKSNDSVADILLTVMENRKDFTFERSNYTYGTRFDEIMGVKSTDKYEWRMFSGDKDVTYTINSTKVVDGGVYTLKYIPFEN